MTATKNAIVDRRYDFVLLFDVQDGNPNGDPDAGNLPRIDPQTLQGFVTDVCIKRKIRNAVAAIAGDRAGCGLYFQTQDAVYEKRVLNLVHQSAYDALGIQQVASEPDLSSEAVTEPPRALKGKRAKGSDKGDFDNVSRARAWMCQQFYDVRTFGAVMTTGVNCGQVRGPAQLTFSRSIDSIVPMDVTITRKAVTTVKDASKQINKPDSDTGMRFGTITGTMGRKHAVPYALYRGHGFINANLAKDTGFTYGDLSLFFRALQMMFDLDRSATRGLMSVRGLHVFQHATALGEAPAHLLFDRIVTPKLGSDQAPRSFADYKQGIKIRGDLPTGVGYRDLTAEPITDSTFPW